MNILHSEVVNLYPDTTSWLQHAVELMDAGQGHTLRPAPFYARRDLITEEVIASVIGRLEEYLKSEIQRYPSYHNLHQHISGNDKLVSPGYDKLPPHAQRALVERLDELIMTIRNDEPIPEVVSPESVYNRQNNEVWC